LLGVCGFALFSAIASLSRGGRAPNASHALLYGMSAAIACFGVALVQWRVSRKTHSELLLG
jgi:predicted Co/Zn/Cd cation transporter (cation efflux family)